MRHSTSAEENSGIPGSGRFPARPSVFYVIEKIKEFERPGDTKRNWPTTDRIGRRIENESTYGTAIFTKGILPRNTSMRQLMPHQQQALDYTKGRTRIALFMEMRLGKTLVAIRWLNAWGVKRVLIVCPLPVMRTWREELLKEEWAEEDIQLVKGDSEERVGCLLRPATWFIVNYEALLATHEILGLNWDGIVLDESTRIRNPRAKTTRLLCDRSYHIRLRGILTGLPNPESFLDFFEQMNFLWGNFMHCTNYWIFRKKFFNQYGHEWCPTNYVKDQIKAAVKVLSFSMTRKQAGIKIQKVYEKRYVKLNEEQAKLYKQISDDFEFTRTDGKIQDTKWAPVKFQWLARVAGGFSPEGRQISNAKYEELSEILGTELKGEPTIVWFRYNQELEQAALFLTARGFTVGTFTGANKEDAEKFARGTIQVLLAQSKCGQFGLDWSRASTAIYYSNWYDGEVRAQSEDRIVHPKKKDILLYIDLIAEDSIDEDVVGILREKKINAKLFMMELIERWKKRTISRLTQAQPALVGQSGRKSGN